jgi:hypothetical protein
MGPLGRPADAERTLRFALYLSGGVRAIREDLGRAQRAARK